MTTPYAAFPNSFRRRLAAKETLIGCWATLASNLTTEVLGYAGFDWLLIDGEHAPNDFESFITQLQALKDSVSAPIVRPQWAEPVILKRLLDIGFSNFLLPFIDSAEQARAAVSATRYPPQGTRGIALGHRGNKFGYVPNYLTTANENICVLVQIESATAIKNVDEIAAVDGVDGLFIGPSDLSAALGHLGDPAHADVQSAIQTVVESGKKAGKAVGILATREEDARRYLAMGMTFVAVGVDVALFKDVTKALCDRFKS